MVLLLSSADVEQALEIADAVDALEESYRGVATGRAINRPRSHTFTPSGQGGSYHLFKTLEGGACDLGLYALRINSELWRLSDTGRVAKVPAVPDGRYVEFVLFFSLENGQLVAILPDGILQKMRVAMTHALAAKHLLPSPAHSMGLFGTGWQASAQAEVQARIHGLQLIRVFSPNVDRRRAFAARMAEKLRIEVQAVDDPAGVVRDVDFVVAATNAQKPVLSADMLRPGLHLSSIRSSTEVSSDVVARCNRRFVQNRDEPLNYFCDDSTPASLVSGRKGDFETSGWPTLAELIAGKVTGRSHASDITLMVDGYSGGAGLGTQFVAVGASVIARARQLGLGRELPLDWFLDAEDHSH